MGSAQTDCNLRAVDATSARSIRLLRGFALICLLIFAAPAGLTAQNAAAQNAASQDGAGSGILSADDLGGAIDELRQLAAFYGEIAGRDSNGFAASRWTDLQSSYAAMAGQLTDLLGSGRLRIVDLPEGSLRISQEGDIEIDDRLDGRWLPSLVRAQRRQGRPEAQNSDVLLPVLIQALSQVNDARNWPWFDEHMRRAGTLGPITEEGASRAELARYFFLKDRYLSLSMRRIAEGDPGLRHDWARRQMRAFTEVRGLRRDFATRFGAGPAETLRDDWSNYVALVDGFAVTRGWLMLDPTLRLTRLQRTLPDGTVERAAEEIVEARQTSILSPRAGQRPAGLPDPQPAEALPYLDETGPSLSSLVRRVETRAARQALQNDVAASFPVQALLLRPEFGAAGYGASGTAEFRAFAERLKTAMRQPDPALELAKRDRALNAAERELALANARINALEPVEREVSALQERVRVLNEAERQVEALKSQVGELDEAQEQVAALQAQVDELGAALNARDGEAGALQEQLAEARSRLETAPESTIVPAVSRIEERQLYMMAAIAVMFVLTLLLWARRRERPVAVYQPPSEPARIAPAPARLPPPPERSALNNPPPDVIDVPPLEETRPLDETADVEPEAACRNDAAATQQETVNGVAHTEISAADVHEVASADNAAVLGDEKSAAGHPIVKALRKGNLPLFELLFSELTDLRSPQLQRIVYGGRGEDLAIVCRAVEVDKLLFGAIFLLTDHLRGGDADNDPNRVAEILALYDRTAPSTARKALLKWQRNWGAGPLPTSTHAD